MQYISMRLRVAISIQLDLLIVQQTLYHSDRIIYYIHTLSIGDFQHLFLPIRFGVVDYMIRASIAFGYI